MKQLNIIVCPICHGQLTESVSNKYSSIVSCKYHRYPKLFGIYYFKEDYPKQQALLHLTRGAEFKAILVLLNSTRRHLLSLILVTLPLGYLSLYLNKYDRLRNIRTWLFNIVTIINRIFFGYDAAWSKYILNRTKIPSYFIGLSVLNALQPSDTVTDIGCGVGHFLPEINLRVNPKHVVGIDQSLAHLILAKLFYAKPQNLLVCTDLNKPLPLLSAVFNMVYVNDTFHNLLRKTDFIKESYRILVKSGSLELVHNHIKSEDTIYGIKPDLLFSQLKSAGFMNIRCISNEQIWKTLVSNQRTLLPKFSSKTQIPFDIYHFQASRYDQKTLLHLNETQYYRLVQTKIFYHGDRNLPVKISLMKLMDKFDRFIFISPHLDDAILSSGQLVSLLSGLGSKVTIITVFTQGSPPPLSPQASAHLKDSGYENTFKFFSDRKSEDRNAAKIIGASFVHLNFIDAAWRKTRSKFTYSQMNSQFSGKIAAVDYKLSEIINRKLVNHISDLGTSLLFGPLGVGNHVDHILVRQILSRLNFPIIYWIDQPYSLTFTDMGHQLACKFGLKIIPELNTESEKVKALAVNSYSSQIKSLFTHVSLSDIREHFYTTAKLKAELF